MNSIKINKLTDNKFYSNKERVKFDTSYIAFVDGHYITNAKGDKILIEEELENNIDEINENYIYNTVLTDKIMYKSDVILCENIILLIGDKLYDYIGRELFLSGISKKFDASYDEVVVDYSKLINDIKIDDLIFSYDKSIDLNASCNYYSEIGFKYFGISIKLTEDYCYITCIGDDKLKSKVIIYDLNGNIIKEIEAPTVNSNFGIGLEVTKNNIIIGDIKYNNNNGIVYVYDLEYNLVKTIENPKSSENGLDYFGRDIISNDNYIIINSPYYNLETQDYGGIVYVYDSEFNLIKSLENPNNDNSSSTDEFSRHLDRSMAINDNYLFIGAASEYIDNFYTCGVVYIYDINSNFDLIKTLNSKVSNGEYSSENKSFEHFGASICVSSKYICISSPYKKEEIGAGEIFIFDMDFNLIRILKNTINNSYFGMVIRMTEHYLIVLNYSSKIDVYRLDTFENVKYIEDDMSYSYGSSIEINDERFLIGDYSKDNGNENSGIVYEYTFSENE
jgi:hypothetical protein